jgi:hypothetical protein
MVRPCYVYHIKRSGFNLNEGYIGVSYNPKYRFYQHKKSKTHVGNAINLYKEDVELSIILCASRKYCLEIEAKLRPVDNIGWNEVAGGGNPPVHYGADNWNTTQESRTFKSKTFKGKPVPLHVKENLLNMNYNNSYRAGTGAIYIVTTPDGTEVEVKEIKRWCKERNLECSNLTKVARGLRKQHKGYTCRFKEETT